RSRPRERRHRVSRECGERLHPAVVARAGFGLRGRDALRPRGPGGPPATAEGPGGMSALEVQGLGHDFGGLRALDDVTLDVPPGERLAILGPNGAGKTTLFNAITGLLRPARGRIRLHGEDVTRLGPHARAQRGLGRT